MEGNGKAYSIYIIMKSRAFSGHAKEKQKRCRKVLTKGEKSDILTKLSREGR